MSELGPQQHIKTGTVDMQKVGERIRNRTFAMLGLRPLKLPKANIAPTGKWETRCERCGIKMVYLHEHGPDLALRYCSHCLEDRP